MSLSPRERKFVEAYLATNDATEAALIAGYKAGSRNALRVQGHKLAHREKIKKAIEEAIKDRVIEADAVLAGIKEIALNTNERAADRLRAYELLGRHLNLFAEKQKHEVSGGVSIEIEYVNTTKNSA